MAIFLWDDAYSIGIAEIDQQHRNMFETMLVLHQAMRSGNSGTQIEPTLLELIERCSVHFRTEEALMAFHGFPELGNHRSEHRLIGDQLRTFLTEAKAGKPGLIVDLLEYVEDWQGIHVLQHDMKYRDFLMQQWGMQFKQGQLKSEVQETREGDARRHARVSCSIAVELRSLMESPVVFAKCVNISRSGAFLRTWSPLRVNTTAMARFQLGASSAEVRVCIRRSEPCVGMGVSFLQPIPNKLLEAIVELEQMQIAAQRRPTEVTCDRLLHDCLQQLAALEDVISDAEITRDTAAAVRSLVTRARRLERVAEISTRGEHQ